MKPTSKLRLQSKKTWFVLSLCIPLFFGCSNLPNNSSGNQASSDKIVTPKNPDGLSVAVGSIVKTSATEIDLDVNDQNVPIGLADSPGIYATSPGTLDSVLSNSYIGVATTKQSGGSDQVAQIFIFPEELRGLNEGSVLLGGEKDPKEGRMTNGSASRMSNGCVKETGGSSLTVQYQGYSRTVNAP